jgi:hypothetical protein
MATPRHRLRLLSPAVAAAVAVLLLCVVARGYFFVIWIAALVAGAGLLLLLRGRSFLIGLGLLVGCLAVFAAGLFNYE